MRIIFNSKSPSKVHACADYRPIFGQPTSVQRFSGWLSKNHDENPCMRKIYQSGVFNIIIIIKAHARILVAISTGELLYYY